MARRKPLDASKGAAEPAAAVLSDVDLDEMLWQARVPAAKRAACANDIRELLDWYNSRIATNKNELNEARQAESYARVAEDARALLSSLSRMPSAERLAIEPDYRAFAERMRVVRLVEAVAYAAATKELAESNPDDQEAQEIAREAQEIARMTDARLVAEKCRGREYSSFPDQLPLEFVLTDLIEKAEDCRRETEKMINRNWSKERGTYAKKQLALNLKAIVIGYSPTLRKDEAAAEEWAADVLDLLGLSRPSPEKRLAELRKLFETNREPPFDHVVRLSQARNGDSGAFCVISREEAKMNADMNRSRLARIKEALDEAREREEHRQAAEER
jgi:hypothetical protein